jgi:hypothetical protein
MLNSQRWLLVIVVAFVAIGVGFGVWLGFFRDTHNYTKQLSQEDWAAQYVAAVERPKSKIEIKVSDESCVRITRAEIEGTYLLMYAQNDCHFKIHYMEWRWQTSAPDGTYLTSGYENTAACPVPREPGSKAECKARLTSYWNDDGLDDRISALHVSVREVD